MKNLTAFISLLFMFCPYVFSQNTDTEYYIFKPYTTIGGHFIVHSGIWGGTVPAIPEERSTALDGTPYYGPAFGIDINYHFTKNISLYFDISRYTRNTPVAYKGGYASSFWIFEQTDYSVFIAGPFEEDAFYNVQATGFRLGLKAYLQHEKKIQPWIGVYWGYYNVLHGIYNKGMSKTWGNGNGYVSGLSYINFGTDIWDKTRTLGISLFYEYGAPVYRNYSINDCIVKGWTFKDEGEGEPIFGYNRIGIAVIIRNVKNNEKM